MLTSIPAVLSNGSTLPERATSGAAGYDLTAAIAAPVILPSLERKLIPTGIRVAIPAGYEGQVRPRSGNALKLGLTVLNTPGTIDSDYRGDVGVILVNLSHEPITVTPGMRIAQLVFAKVETPEIYAVKDLDSTERGEGGYGSTGTHT